MIESAASIRSRYRSLWNGIGTGNGGVAMRTYPTICLSSSFFLSMSSRVSCSIFLTSSTECLERRTDMSASTSQGEPACAHKACTVQQHTLIYSGTSLIGTPMRQKVSVRCPHYRGRARVVKRCPLIKAGLLHAVCRVMLEGYLRGCAAGQENEERTWLAAFSRSLHWVGNKWNSYVLDL